MSRGLIAIGWRLVLLFTGVPILELFLLIKLGGFIGPLPTVLLVLFTGVFGAYLARREGLHVLQEIRGKMRSGQAPTGELLDGAVILVSGALLLTPGLLTDFLGFAGLIPASREFLKTRGWEFVKSRWFTVTTDSGESEPKDVDIDDYDL